jgi:hypothetical protein
MAGLDPAMRAFFCTIRWMAGSWPAMRKRGGNGERA